MKGGLLVLSERTSNALTGISKATLQKGVRIKHLFRIMTHYPELWMEAYANIYANKGAVTRGVDNNTLDGMCQDRISNLISLLKDGRYKPGPVKRVYIPKKNGKRRPLGVPSGDDKLVQEVVRILLEVVYEPVFSDRSHGFRPQRSCHTALDQVHHHWKGTKWIVDMDIRGFYDNIDHDKMIEILEKKIDDREFIALIRNFLRAGYLEEWKFHASYSGTPQGGICSPILANIFLNELDEFIGKMTAEFNKGRKRKRNPAYYCMQEKILRRRRLLRSLEESGESLPLVISELKKELQSLEEQRRSMPSFDVEDEGFKRLHYVRYADDFALGIIGPKTDAHSTAEQIREFLKQELHLDVAEEKSGIHHIQKGFDFLGHHIWRAVKNDRTRRKRFGIRDDGTNYYGTQRTLTSQIQLQLPLEKVWAFCRDRKYLWYGTIPHKRLDLIHLSDYEIVATINAEMRGFANFYAMTPRRNLYILEWAATSCLFKTLADKHKTSSQQIRRQMKQADEHVLRYELNGKQRQLTVFKIKHAKRSDGTAVNREADTRPLTCLFRGRTEITQRMSAGECEYCGKQGGYFEVHHVRKLKDVMSKKDRTPWETVMCQRKRKTLVLCVDCHKQLHKGTLQGWKRNLHTEVESVVQ